MSEALEARLGAGSNARLAGRIGLAVGLALALGLQLFPPPEGLSREGWIVASLGVLMAVWWATEAIPIPATALLPLVVLPATGVLSTTAAGAPYASATVLLFMGGFMVALALERWTLHARIALNIVARAGGRPRLMVLGFMVAAGVLSMWISNTATTLMMIPIALSVAQAEARDDGTPGTLGPFAPALLLGVAYAASIGGVATPIGTPTNLAALGYLQQNAGVSIGFAQWMAIGLPVAVVFIPLTWLVLTRLAFKVDAAGGDAGAQAVRARLAALGPLSTPEARVALVFAAVALTWILRQPAVDLLIAALERGGAEGAAAYWRRMNGADADASIALAGALALFLIPAGGERGRGRALMDWATAVRLPWGVLLLFGGGLSLAAAIQATGLAEWLGSAMGGLAVLPAIVIVLALVTVIIFLTELTSNTATVTAFMPVVGALAIEADVSPVLLAAPAAIAGSFAFMFPVGTPPNAIVYASGHVTMPEMIKAGFRLNLIGIVVVTAAAAVLTPLVFG